MGYGGRRFFNNRRNDDAEDLDMMASNTANPRHIDTSMRSDRWAPASSHVPHVPGRRQMGQHRHLSIVTMDLNYDRLLSSKQLVKKTYATAMQDWIGREGYGFDSYFRGTCPIKRLPMYTFVLDRAAYLCFKSAKLQYLCKIIYKTRFGTGDDAKFRGKLMVFVDWPTNQWDIEVLSTLL